MLLKVGQRPDHTFDEPLGLLSDCHRRIEQFLSVLATIAHTKQGQALSTEDRGALEAALRYLATAAPRHSADEEASLFPRLRSSPDPGIRAAIDTLDRLEADHRVAEEHHDAIEAFARRWLAAGSLPPADADALADHLAVLDDLHRAHIRIEDTEIFPAAARVLTPADLQAVGREMAQRRGLV